MSARQPRTSWTFLTNHAQVLLCIAQNSDVRLRDVAQAVGITERAAQRIVLDLVEANFLERQRVGRRNSYVINPIAEMRHRAQQGHPVGELLNLLRRQDPRESG
ncbi:MAG: helix-turn-helix transcriptional regulator [Gaiellaceae bacterium]